MKKAFCSVCLLIKTRLHTFTSSKYKSFITNYFKQSGYFQVPNKDEYICFECQANLRKTFHFIERALQAQNLLKQMTTQEKHYDYLEVIKEINIILKLKNNANLNIEQQHVNYHFTHNDFLDKEEKEFDNNCVANKVNYFGRDNIGSVGDEVKFEVGKNKLEDKYIDNKIEGDPGNIERLEIKTEEHIESSVNVIEVNESDEGCEEIKLELEPKYDANIEYNTITPLAAEEINLEPEPELSIEYDDTSTPQDDPLSIEKRRRRDSKESELKFSLSSIPANKKNPGPKTVRKRYNEWGVSEEEIEQTESEPELQCEPSVEYDDTSMPQNDSLSTKKRRRRDYKQSELKSSSSLISKKKKKPLKEAKLRVIKRYNEWGVSEEETEQTESEPEVECEPSIEYDNTYMPQNDSVSARTRRRRACKQPEIESSLSSIPEKKKKPIQEVTLKKSKTSIDCGVSEENINKADEEDNDSEEVELEPEPECELSIENDATTPQKDPLTAKKNTWRGYEQRRDYKPSKFFLKLSSIPAKRPRKEVQYKEKELKTLKKKADDCDEDYAPTDESSNSDGSLDLYTEQGRRLVNKDTRVYPMQCDDCDAIIYEKKSHYWHYMELHRDLPYPYARVGVAHLCALCGYTAKTKLLYDKHMMHVHSTGREQCPECPKTFSSVRSVQRHLAFAHRPRTLYHCDYCRKIFKSKGDIRLHIRIHTGDKPYKCHICGAGFAHNGNVGIHIRAKHQNERTGKRTSKTNKTEKRKKKTKLKLGK